MKDFQEFDTNKDGYIDAYEVKKLFSDQLKIEDLSAFFIACDKDEDGLISRDEYLEAGK